MSELDENITKSLIEILALRNAEKIVHSWNDIEHKEECVICSENCDPCIALVLDLYFCMLGKMYFAMFNLDTDGEGAWSVANFPLIQLQTPCGICSGIIETYENAVALPFCNHTFHEFCLYKFIHQSVTSGEMDRIVCPHRNCRRSLFLSYADQINGSTPMDPD